ncbi:hypothetical protein KBK19_04925 [Microvirga sp. STR05]|uniref:Uncharacterized protein n=1 Tax=Hymenobacter duratus TaxID=2771356 RepID=A0ABR8JFC3_9BACT|nr:hypothetical protein [Hymenobacter duratus]MBD2714373.1 hypothetical protein [Hymenobacter duratus]MBR7949276.1 hypothetical protein [Microvirga sp. STR05]
MNGWLRGRPLEEVALMNRILEKLLHKECTSWPEPFKFPYKTKREIFMLHRRGLNKARVRNKDAYGSDFAVTVNVFGVNPKTKKIQRKSSFSKTALFQLKAGNTDKISLNLAQLTDSQLLFKDRSFVLYANEATGEYRVKAVEPLLVGFVGDSKSFDTSEREWLTLSEWLVLWLTCQQGIPSTDWGRRVTAKQLAFFYLESGADEVRREDKGRLLSFVRDGRIYNEQYYRRPIGDDQSLNENGIDDGFYSNQPSISLELNGPVAWLNISIYVTIPEEPKG